MKQEHIEQINKAVAAVAAKEKINHFYFVACGGSQAFMMPAQYMFDREIEIPADIYAEWDAKEAGSQAEQQWNDRFAAYQAEFPELRSRQIPGQSVDAGPQNSGVKAAESLPHQGGNHPGQDIAHPAGGHAAVPGRIHPNPSLRRRHHRVPSLQQQRHPVTPGKIRRKLFPRPVDLRNRQPASRAISPGWGVSTTSP